MKFIFTNKSDKDVLVLEKKELWSFTTSIYCDLLGNDPIHYNYFDYYHWCFCFIFLDEEESTETLIKKNLGLEC